MHQPNVFVATVKTTSTELVGQDVSDARVSPSMYGILMMLNRRKLTHLQQFVTVEDVRILRDIGKLSLPKILLSPY